MAERDDLLASIAATIADYREGDLAAPTPEHVERWINQFDAAVRLPILREMDHVLKRTYFSRARTAKFLAGLFQTKKLVGDDPCAFWKGVKFLDIQGGGASQTQMLALFSKLIKANCGFEVSECGKDAEVFVYIDDAIFTENRVKQDIEKWIVQETPAKSTVHIVMIAMHTGARYCAEQHNKGNILKAAKDAGKDITFHWRCALDLENQRAHTDSSDVLRPVRIPDDAAVAEYVEAMTYKPHLRTPGQVGGKGIFSSDEARQLLEEEFLKAGVRIRQMCPNLNKYQRPLGNMLLETLGFGSLIVTFQELSKQRASRALGGRSLASLVPTNDQQRDVHEALHGDAGEGRVLMSQASQVRTYDPAVSVVFLMTNERFGGLSNMAPGFPLRVNGVRIRTSEALYQACRFPHMPDVQRKIIDEHSPMTAKMRSKPFRKVSRPDWDAVRVKIMRWCLRVKRVQNWREFGRLLLATGDSPIVEQSRKDDFWGAKVAEDGSLLGMNVLGRLLMELREQFKGDEAESLWFIEPLAIPDFLLFGQPVEAVQAPPNAHVPGWASRKPPETVAAPAPPSDPQPSLFEQPMILEARTSERHEPSAPTQTAMEPSRYPSYRPPRVQWLGEIPAHWSEKRGKYFFREIDERSQTGEEELLSVSHTTGVTPRSHKSVTMFKAESYAGHKVARPNDIVVNTMWAWMSALGVSKDVGIVSPAYGVYRPLNDADFVPAYVDYLLRTPMLRWEYICRSTGIRSSRLRLYPDKFLDIAFPCPPREEKSAWWRFCEPRTRRSAA